MHMQICSNNKNIKMSNSHDMREILNAYGEDGNGRINGEEIAKVLPDYDSIIDFLPGNNSSAIVDPVDKDA